MMTRMTGKTAVARESIVNPLLCPLRAPLSPAPARGAPGLYFHKTFPASSACDRENARARPNVNVLPTGLASCRLRGARVADDKLAD